MKLESLEVKEQEAPQELWDSLDKGDQLEHQLVIMPVSLILLLQILAVMNDFSMLGEINDFHVYRGEMEYPVHKDHQVQMVPLELMEK